MIKAYYSYKRGGGNIAVHLNKLLRHFSEEADKCHD
jgi:hypothetical protein